MTYQAIHKSASTKRRVNEHEDEKNAIKARTCGSTSSTASNRYTSSTPTVLERIDSLKRQNKRDDQRVARGAEGIAKGPTKDHWGYIEVAENRVDYANLLRLGPHDVYRYISQV